MSDLPPILEPAAPRRHWLEYIATATALVISAVSLWVAVGTMDANKKMVAASSWPFLQITTSDTTADGKNELIFELGNAGVGPAMVESFEVSLDGKLIHSSRELMERCCGFDPNKQGLASVTQPAIGSWTEGTVGGSVIRAGENRTFFRYPQTPENLKAWNTLRNAVSNRRLLARACYCSVFEECWQAPFVGLHPQPVDRCVEPKVPFTE
jgi:hypothetical protein